MARYISDKKLWLSHECRAVEAGVEFETEFPKGPGGKPMVLGEGLREIKRGKSGAEGATEKAE